MFHVEHLKLKNMPDGQNNDAAIAAGVSLANNTINAVSAAQTNRRQRQWMEEQYDRQRRDALADRDWQTAYNDPSAQAARMEAAGFNKNLLAGKGTTEAPAIRSSQIGSWNPQAPRFDLNSAIGQYQAIKLQGAQIDATKAATENAKQENRLLQVKELQDLLNLNTSGVSNRIAVATEATQVSAIKGNLAKLLAETNQIGTNIAHTENMDMREQERIELDKDKFGQERKESNTRISKILTDIRSTEKGMQLMQAHIDNVIQDTGVKGAQLEEIRAATRKLISEGNIEAFRDKMKEIDKGVQYGEKVLNAIISLKGRTTTGSSTTTDPNGNTWDHQYQSRTRLR